MDISLIEQLQQTEGGKLRRFFLRRLRNREDAADATQETFLRLLTASPKEDLRNPHAYLFQVARSVAHGITARLMRDSALFDDELDQTQVADEAPGPERVVAARQQLGLLIETISSLPPKCRVVFVLSRLEGLSNGEIATKLGISRNMVEKHIIRALMACRQARLAALAPAGGLRMTNVSDKAREDAIAEEAAGWVARLGSHDATDADRRRFEFWKIQDPAHAAAFEEMSSLWGDLAAVPKTVAPRRRRMVGGGIAALLLLMGCLGIIASETGLIARYRSDFYTPVGVIQRIDLDDGSVVTLNTDSAIKVRYGQTERRIVVLRGEAFFDVTPNPARPFVVSGDETQAIALGTHYAVRVGERDEVMVEEGHVAVTAGSERAVLETGGTAHLGADGRLATGSGDVADLTSWRSGKLVFSGRPLGEVLDRIGRYQRGRIMVLDDQASQLRVSGVFAVNDVNQTFTALQESLPIRIIRLSDWVTLVRSR